MDVPGYGTIDPNAIDEDAIRAYYYSCNEVTPFCPVQATTLGYFPNKGVNCFFAVVFGLAMVTTFVLGVWKRTWSYMAFITAGCALELAGYASRIPLSTNPWNKEAFETQICAIILAPTLVCISIYLTLKHVCLSLNPSLSRVRPHLYPFIFVPLDASCLLVQAIGGALAATAGYTNYALLQHGNRAIIAGITLQVIVLLFFGATALDYYLRVKRWIGGASRTPENSAADPEAVALWRDKKFRAFIYSVAGAYCGVLIRCIYRIAEMAGGWGNRIMQDEPSFIILEGFMILIPCILLAVFPPGFLFPQMAARISAKSAPRTGSRFGFGRKSESSAEKVDQAQEQKHTIPTVNAADEKKDVEQVTPRMEKTE
ncbi:RTA1 like protein-domain-containing protein [Podospora didyma]|uniref:RTA1 like protein-domain-containing protein n=1 Tax=Podospora didyma TaxID=330526 RepID=A0AAE0NX23_9PEZI|nr:RTA1 like protein-domain-containing protein [Podospora didyma]